MMPAAATELALFIATGRAGDGMVMDEAVITLHNNDSGWRLWLVKPPAALRPRLW